MAPIFLNEQDPGCYPVDQDKNPTSNTLVWPGSSWGFGDDSMYPSTVKDDEQHPFAVPGISSFQALDTAVSFFSNTSLFPKMNTIVVAGHSLGGQMVQRYSLLGAVVSGNVPVHFVVANPASYAYLTNDRPNSTAGCLDTFNNYKYGLQNYNLSYLSDFVTDSVEEVRNVESIVDRFRKLAWMYGLADLETGGDASCEASSQGSNHLDRGRKWINHVSSFDGRLPTSHSVDYVANVGHDGFGMYNSAAGHRHLFIENYNGTEEPQGVGNNDTDTINYRSRHNKAAEYPNASEKKTIFSTLLWMSVFAIVSLLIFG